MNKTKFTPGQAAKLMNATLTVDSKVETKETLCNQNGFGYVAKNGTVDYRSSDKGKITVDGITYKYEIESSHYHLYMAHVSFESVDGSHNCYASFTSKAAEREFKGEITKYYAKDFSKNYTYAYSKEN